MGKCSRSPRSSAPLRPSPPPVQAASQLAPSLPETVPDLDPEADDAFTTAMAWLYSRIPATRG